MPTARRRRAMPITCSALLVLQLVACERAPAPWREELFVFGTQATIEIRATPAEQARRAGLDLAQRFAGFHRDWHAWEPSALTRLNSAIANGTAAEPPDSILKLIERAQALHYRSDALVDPGIGGLVSLWGFHTSDYPLTSPPPDAASIEAWRAKAPSVMDLRIDGGRVGSRNPAVQLDFGAIAEGMAAEAAVETLRMHGIADALLNLGGDVMALGSADGRPWQVALRDPGGGILGSVALSGREALFSSGSYQKFRRQADGARWPHVLDPRSGYPARGTASAVVLHPDPVLADAAATALLIGGMARFADLLERLGVRCALLLDEDDSLWLTTGMAARLRLLRQPASQRPALDRGDDCAAP